MKVDLLILLLGIYVATWFVSPVFTSQSDLSDLRDEEDSDTCGTVIPLREAYNWTAWNMECRTNSMCRSSFNASLVDLMPYSDHDEVLELLWKCCGSCVTMNYTVVAMFNDYTEMTTSAIRSSHFVYPILAWESTRRYYGFHYVPIINARRPIYVTRRQGRLLPFLLELGPFIAICLLMAIIAGFIAWAIESRKNADFSESFFPGVFQGFWWSFVTMTTVGYGDKNMNSVPGKVFAIVWILFGIVGFGLLTGELTTLVMNLRGQQVDHMANVRVGVLKNRQYEMYIASRYGGVVHMNGDEKGFYADALQLVEKLKSWEIEGVLFDMFTMAHVTELIQNTTVLEECMSIYYPNISDSALRDFSQRWSNVREFFLKETVRTEKHYEGEKLTYGMLIKRSTDYRYFKDSIAEERLRIELTWDRKMKERLETLPFPKILDNHSESYFNFYFNLTFYTILGILAAFMICGALYEGRRRRKVLKGRDECKRANFKTGEQCFSW